MRKLFFSLFACCLLGNGMLSAQSTEEKYSAFQFSFFPSLSTNGREAAQYSNGVSINLLAGVSKNERILAFAGLGNIIKNNASGVQFAGLGNIVGNESKGVQFGGLANITGAGVSGMQFGGLFNITGAEMRGVQFGGLTNITGDKVTGMQFSGLFNITGDKMSGVQFAGGLNITGEAVTGLQFGGLANIAGNSFSGVQVAGLANVAGGTSSGLQFAGIGNKLDGKGTGVLFAGLGNKTKAGYKGVQVAGLGNVAEDISGLQFGGLFNVARNVKGVQFAGLVNIAENSDYPVGLVNIIKNGEKSVGVSYSESGSVTASFRSGGRVMYGILGVGYNHRTDDEPFVAEGGFGVHIPVVERFRINTELKTQFMTSFSDTHVSLSGLSILPAFRILPQLELFAGPSLNYGETDNPENKSMFPGHDLWKKEKEDRYQQLFFGYTVGIQFVF